MAANTFDNAAFKIRDELRKLGGISVTQGEDMKRKTFCLSRTDTRELFKKMNEFVEVVHRLEVITSTWCRRMMGVEVEEADMFAIEV